jgi:hypothetical protein
VAESECAHPAAGAIVVVDGPLDGICERLFLSPKTSGGHVGNIFRKLDMGAASHRRVVAVLTFLRACGAA